MHTLNNWLTSHSYTLFKYLFSGIAGLVAVYLPPTLPYIAFAVLFIVLDCASAYRLARRIKKKNGKSSAKMRSKKLWKALLTIIYSTIAIMLALSVERNLLTMYTDLYLPNWTAIVICLIQIWSILENESSCTDSPWPKGLRKILIDKSERHFDVDLSFLDEKEEIKWNT